MSNQIEMKNTRILIVDDNRNIHSDFRQILLKSNAGSEKLEEAKEAIFGQATVKTSPALEIDSAYDGHEALEKTLEAERNGTPYAMAFVDMRMEAQWNGLDTIENLWRVQPNLQIAICTAYSDYSWTQIIERLGETDKLLIIKKPFDNIEVRQTACSLIEKWHLLNKLEQIVQQRTEQIQQTRDTAVFVLASLAESRDPETGEHLERIRSYCHILAEELRENSIYSEWIDDEFIENLYRSSPLHDIGKIGIPDSILLKPGTLSEREFSIMKQHSLIGAEALSKTTMNTSGENFLSMATEIAKYHHECFDGSGYPEGLRGKEIPLSARIVTLADVYDALTSSRVYKPAFKAEIAYLMIKEERGRHFDPVVVDAFLARIDDFLKIRMLTQTQSQAEAVI
ncbi:MAG: HD domain-containing protein [Anaerohalosphaeraceae bacterium]|nr:HD domain-containing protein [Anaerohalosphaeraceae bacterium]